MFISYPLSTDSVMLLCVFFFASFSSPHVFIWLAGTVDQRPHGNAPAEWTNKHMQMWLHRSQADGSDLSSSSCSPHTVCLQAINLTHSITYTHTHTYTHVYVCVCVNTDCQSPERNLGHCRENYVRAWGWACHHPLQKTAVNKEN